MSELQPRDVQRKRNCDLGCAEIDIRTCSHIDNTRCLRICPQSSLLGR